MRFVRWSQPVVKHTWIFYDLFDKWVFHCYSRNQANRLSFWIAFQYQLAIPNVQAQVLLLTTPELNISNKNVNLACFSMRNISYLISEMLPVSMWLFGCISLPLWWYSPSQKHGDLRSCSRVREQRAWGNTFPLSLRCNLWQGAAEMFHSQIFSACSPFHPVQQLESIKLARNQLQQSPLFPSPSHLVFVAPCFIVLLCISPSPNLGCWRWRTLDPCARRRFLHGSSPAQTILFVFLSSLLNFMFLFVTAVVLIVSQKLPSIKHMENDHLKFIVL